MPRERRGHVHPEHHDRQRRPLVAHRERDDANDGRWYTVTGTLSDNFVSTTTIKVAEGAATVTSFATATTLTDDFAAGLGAGAIDYTYSTSGLPAATPCSVSVLSDVPAVIPGGRSRSVTFATGGCAGGLFTLGVTARDTAGNAATRVDVNVTIDNVAPAALAVTNVTSATRGPDARWYSRWTTAPTLVGTVTDNFVSTTTVSVKDGATEVTSLAVTSTSWTTGGLVLSSGAHALTVEAVDAANGSAVPFALDVVRDETAPVIAVDPTNTYEKATFSMTASLSDNQPTSLSSASLTYTVAVTPIGGACTVTPSAVRGEAAGAQTLTLTFPATTCVGGEVTVTFSASDAAGNPAAPVTRRVMIDTGAPTVAITGPADGSWLGGWSGGTALLSGTATDAQSGVKTVRVTVGGTAQPDIVYTPAPGTVSWSKSIPLATGDNNISVEVFDAAGNPRGAPLTWMLRYDPSPPTLNVQSHTIYDERTFTIKFDPSAHPCYARWPEVATQDCSANVVAPAPTTDLALGVTPSVYKYATRFDSSAATENPLAYWLNVADVGPSGLPATGAVELRLSWSRTAAPAASGATAWLPATPESPAPGVSYVAYALASGANAVPELKTVEGVWTMSLRATDAAGNVSSVTTVQWNHFPLAPPVQIALDEWTTPSSRSMRYYGLESNKLSMAKLVNGTGSFVAGENAGLARFVVRNGTSEPANVKFINPGNTATYRTASYEGNATLAAYTPLYTGCGNLGGVLFKLSPITCGYVEKFPTQTCTPAGCITNLSWSGFGDRVILVNPASDTEVASCAGCDAGEFTIPARIDESTPTERHAILVEENGLGNLKPLRDNAADVVVDTSFPMASATYTGTSYEEYVYCSSEDGATAKCLGQTKMQRYRILRSATLSASNVYLQVRGRASLTASQDFFFSGGVGPLTTLYPDFVAATPVKLPAFGYSTTETTLPP